MKKNKGFPTKIVDWGIEPDELHLAYFLKENNDNEKIKDRPKERKKQ